MPTRGREVKMILQNKGMERGVILLLEELFERQAALEQMMNDTNAMQIQIMDIIAKTVDGTAAMRDQIERMDRSKRDADDLDVGKAQ